MEASEAAPLFAALAQETRLALIRLLISAGPSGLPAGEIADRLAVAPSTVSFHLSALERAGLTQSTRQGRNVIHAVRLLALRDLIAFVTETCCGSRPELCGDLARLFPELPPEKTHMTPAFNVLFLCTRNSARSLLAEAILNKIGAGRFRAYSAGSEPAPRPMPEVVAKLAALGHDVSRLHTKSWTVFQEPDAPLMDFVIALCDVLDGQRCPDFGDSVITASWPLPDPAKFQGSEAERGLLLNELYASLHRRLSIFISLPFASLDRMALRARVGDIADAPLAMPARA
jgi:protein-tyrosine-phosphatase/DNA-binding transcriptional ArsR family regulator